ncbi:MAG: hypothetical protein IPK72_21430 [Candidatus Eisenbacteria bacterium]|nr:hypothetical protein [Candidatus Eisenbacteria bacterium]
MPIFGSAAGWCWKVAEGTSTQRRRWRSVALLPLAWRAVARFGRGESGLLDRRAEYGSLKVDEDVRGGIWQIRLAAPKITASSGAPGRWRCWR